MLQKPPQKGTGASFAEPEIGHKNPKKPATKCPKRRPKQAQKLRVNLLQNARKGVQSKPQMIARKPATKCPKIRPKTNPKITRNWSKTKVKMRPKKPVSASKIKLQSATYLRQQTRSVPCGMSAIFQHRKLALRSISP